MLIGLGAFFNFLLSNRLPTRKVKRKEHMSVVFTYLLIVVVFLVAIRIIGWRTYLLIQLPLVWLAGAAGIWQFYVQHQFEGGYWARKSEWEPLRAAMEGSSFYQLSTVPAWFPPTSATTMCITNAGKVLSHRQISGNNLRHRIRKDSSRPCYIVTEVGAGYRLKADFPEFGDTNCSG